MRSFAYFLCESHPDTIILSFGRFNPPHRGHKLLTDLLVSTAARLHADHALWLKGRQGPKDPLSLADKTHYLQMFTSGLRVKADTHGADPLDVVQSYAAAGYRHLILVVGGDRIDKLTQDIQSVALSGHVAFDTFKVISAGARSGTEMWSATAQRASAAADDFDTFADGLPVSFPEHAAVEMFDKVRAGLGLSH